MIAASASAACVAVVVLDDVVEVAGLCELLARLASRSSITPELSVARSRSLCSSSSTGAVTNTVTALRRGA